MDRVAMGGEELPPFNHRSGRIGGRLTRVAGPVCCREGPEIDQEQKQDKAAEAVANPSECVGHGSEVDGEGEEEEVNLRLLFLEAAYHVAGGGWSRIDESYGGSTMLNLPSLKSRRPQVAETEKGRTARGHASLNE
jgi:hypothetical protein